MGWICVMISRDELKDILLSMSCLLDKDEEYGGYIDLHTGDLFDLRKGSAESVEYGTLDEERELYRQNIVAFHTHPRNEAIPEPSGMDFLASHIRGGPEYIITTKGIFEVRPKKIFSLEQIQKVDAEAWIKAQEYEEEYGDPAYWFWKGLLEKDLPVEVTLL